MPGYSRKRRVAQSIRETIDNLPGGICLSTPGGRPILTNRRMNELVHMLTGHTVMNAATTWDELSRVTAINGCARLAAPELEQEQADTAQDDSLLFQFPDGRVWRFHREILRDKEPHYMQLDASDISDLYRYSRELYETNRRLAEQHLRQRRLLANIVEINHEKEMLSAKMRIHDKLGQSLLITKQHLSEGTLNDNIPELADIWNSTIRSLSGFGGDEPDEGGSPEDELLRAADMIGCKIRFIGDKPSGRRPVLLFYAAVREALINAVRHANADELSVAVTRGDNGYHVVITDNGIGIAPAAAVSEGNGLSNLRRRLEQEGAVMRLTQESGVTLTIDLPFERRRAPR